MSDFLTELQLAQSGDDDAIAALMVRFGNDVRFVSSQFQLADNCELSCSDLIQESWIRVWVQIHKFVPASSDSQSVERAFRKWIVQISRHEMINVLKRHQARKRQPPHASMSLEIHEPGSLETPGRLLLDNEEAQNLRMAMLRLPEDLRDLIDHCFFAGRALTDVAQELGLSYSQARRRLADALTELRTLMS